MNEQILGILTSHLHRTCTCLSSKILYLLSLIWGLGPSQRSALFLTVKSRPVLIVNDCAKMTGRHSAAVHKYLSQAFSPRKLLNLINLIKIYDFIFNMISCDRSYDRIQSYIQLAISVLLVLKKPVHMVSEVIGHDRSRSGRLVQR